MVDAGKHASSVIEGDIRTLGPTGWGFGGGSSIMRNRGWRILGYPDPENRQKLMKNQQFS